MNREDVLQFIIHFPKHLKIKEVRNKFHGQICSISDRFFNFERTCRKIWL